MKKSTVVILNKNKTFNSNDELVKFLYQNVSADKLEKFNSYLLENEYNGNLWHTYSEIDYSQGKFKQFFAYEDSSEFFKMLCTSQEFCKLVEEIKNNQWTVSIIEDQ